MNFINDNKTYFRKVLIHMLPLQVTVSFHFYNTMDKVLLVCLTKKRVKPVMTVKLEPHLHNQTITNLRLQIYSTSFHLMLLITWMMMSKQIPAPISEGSPYMPVMT